MATITINGRQFPSPDIGGTLLVATNVSDGKNANGEFIGQKVGRDQYKFDNLQWKMLDAATWSEMMKEFEKFVVTARIPCATTGSPFGCIRETGRPPRWNLTRTACRPCTRTVR